MALAADGTSVYWTDFSGTLMKVAAKGRREVSTLVPPAGVAHASAGNTGTHALAVDATSVYVATGSADNGADGGSDHQGHAEVTIRPAPRRRTPSRISRWTLTLRHLTASTQRAFFGVRGHRRRAAKSQPARRPFVAQEFMRRAPRSRCLPISSSSSSPSGPSASFGFRGARRDLARRQRGGRRPGHAARRICAARRQYLRGRVPRTSAPCARMPGEQQLQRALDAHRRHVVLLVGVGQLPAERATVVGHLDRGHQRHGAADDGWRQRRNDCTYTGTPERGRLCPSPGAC